MRTRYYIATAIAAIAIAGLFFALILHKDRNPHANLISEASTAHRATSSAQIPRAFRTSKNIARLTSGVTARNLNPSKLAYGPATSSVLKKFVPAFDAEMRKNDPNAARDLPVFNAAFYGDTAKLRTYLDSGGSPNLSVRFSQENNIESLLVAAISTGQRGVITELMEAGANVNLNPGGAANTPLVTAAEDGEQDVVLELLAHGANINQMDGNGNVAIRAAVISGNYSTVRELIESGATVSAALTPGGRILPYIEASSSPNFVAISKLLIKNGASP